MKLNKLVTPFSIAAVTFWITWIILNITRPVYLADNPGEVAHLWIKVRVIQGFNGIWTTLLLFAGYRRIIKNETSFVAKVIWAVALTYSFSLLATLINGSVYRYFFEKIPFFSPWHEYLVLAFSKFFIYLGVSIFYFLIVHWQALQLQKEKTLTAVALANEAQLQMLRYQLNPHFLFNALNSIRTLVYIAPEKADQMITDLSDFLRYTLSHEDDYVVTLSDELNIINNYLEIQKIRFEDRLVVEKNIAEEALTFKVPCFLIHPLVENAIKYGLETSPPPLRLKISATVASNTVTATVRNSGRLNGDGASNGCGTGLNNIRKRLDHFFPERNSFSLFEDDGWVHAVITIDMKEDG